MTKSRASRFILPGPFSGLFLERICVRFKELSWLRRGLDICNLSAGKRFDLTPAKSTARSFRSAQSVCGTKAKSTIQCFLAGWSVITDSIQNVFRGVGSSHVHRSILDSNLSCVGGLSICSLLFDVNGLGTWCSLFSLFFLFVFPDCTSIASRV